MRFLQLTFLAIVLTAVSAHAQSGSPVSFEVQVVDPTGASIAGAEVSVQGPGSDATVKSAITDSAGNAAIALTPGIYTINVVSRGFLQYRISDFDTTAQVGLTVKMAISNVRWGPIVAPQEQFLIHTQDATLSALLPEFPAPPLLLAPVKFHRRSR